jgi:hypothetical protein
MNARTPFWPLFKNELEIGWFIAIAGVGMLLAFYWFMLGAFPYVLLFAATTAQGNLAQLFDAGFVPIMLFLMGAWLCAVMIYATIPNFSDLLDPSVVAPCSLRLPSLEYLFTRAINRRLLFRARTAVFFILVLTPLFLSLAIAPFAPQTRFGLADPTSPAAVRRYEQYQKAFPASHPAMNHAMPGQITVPLGAAAFIAWLAWFGTFASVLLQAYGALIAKWITPNPWRTALFAAAPLLAMVGCVLLLTRTSLNVRVDICERSFLLFSTYPIPLVIALAALAAALQIWCERRFSKLEIL